MRCLDQISAKLVPESSVANKRKQLQQTFDDGNMDGERKKSSSSRYLKQIHKHMCVFVYINLHKKCFSDYQRRRSMKGGRKRSSSFILRDKMEKKPETIMISVK